MFCQKLSQYGGDCNICREGAKKTKEQMKLMSQEQVEDKMLELCGYAGSFSNACMETVLEESDVSTSQAVFVFVVACVLSILM